MTSVQRTCSALQIVRSRWHGETMKPSDRLQSRAHPTRLARAKVTHVGATLNAVLLAIALSGCSISMPVVVPPTSPAGSAPTSLSPTAAAPGFVPVAMPWTDGGPMLWPLVWDDGSGNPESEENFSRAVMWTGFLDATAHAVVAPKYATYDYCAKNGRPSRVVALRDGAIDVLALDGTVTRTIKTPGHDQAIGSSIACRDDKRVAVYSAPEGQLDWQVVFDLSTGKKLPAESKASLEQWNCLSDATLPASKLPKGYPVDARGGWAADQDETIFINIETHATIVTKKNTKQASAWGVTSCAGDSSGFLICSGGLLPLVFDKNAKVTPFANVGNTWVLSCEFPQAPFVWATSAGIQGYIDLSGAWHYQEPARTTLHD